MSNDSSGHGFVQRVDDQTSPPKFILNDGEAGTLAQVVSKYVSVEKNQEKKIVAATGSNQCLPSSQIFQNSEDSASSPLSACSETAASEHETWSNLCELPSARQYIYNTDLSASAHASVVLQDAWQAFDDGCDECFVSADWRFPQDASDDECVRGVLYPAAQPDLLFPFPMLERVPELQLEFPMLERVLELQLESSLASTNPVQ